MFTHEGQNRLASTLTEANLESRHLDAAWDESEVGAGWEEVLDKVPPPFPWRKRYLRRGEACPTCMPRVPRLKYPPFHPAKPLTAEGRANTNLWLLFGTTSTHNKQIYISQPGATIYILERCRATIIFVVLLFIRAVRIPVSLLNLIPDCALHFGLDIFCAAPSTRSKSLVSPCFIAFERRPG